MKMDEMNKLFEDYGFTVERKWEPEHDRYIFTICKNGYCHASTYTYPVGSESRIASNHQREFVFRMMREFDKGVSNLMYAIKNVIFNDPATIVFWTDGTKTVVKCQDGDEFNPETGLAMAISKKALGNKGNYCNEFKKWLPKEECPIVLELKASDFSESLNYVQKKIYEFFGLEKDTKCESVQKAYDLLVECRDKGKGISIDEVIGYLGEALED